MWWRLSEGNWSQVRYEWKESSLGVHEDPSGVPIDSRRSSTDCWFGQDWEDLAMFNLDLTMRVWGVLRPFRIRVVIQLMSIGGPSCNLGLRWVVLLELAGIKFEKYKESWQARKILRVDTRKGLYKSWLKYLGYKRKACGGRCVSISQSYERELFIRGVRGRIVVKDCHVEGKSSQ